jgi:hypothetical protein
LKITNLGKRAISRIHRLYTPLFGLADGYFY